MGSRRHQGLGSPGPGEGSGVRMVSWVAGALSGPRGIPGMPPQHGEVPRYLK